MMLGLAIFIALIGAVMLVYQKKPQGWRKRKHGTKRQKGKPFPIFGKSAERTFKEPQMTVRKLKPISVKKVDKEDIRASTFVRVEERGKVVIKLLGDCLPPKSWIEKMAKTVKGRDKTAVIANIWWQLSPEKKLEIMKKTGKLKQVYKHNPFGIMGRRQLRAGEGEQDILPNVAHEIDTGWLPLFEKSIYRQIDADERAEVARLVNDARSSDPARRAVAATELETRYPDAYEHAKRGITGTADIPRSHEPPRTLPSKTTPVVKEVHKEIVKEAPKEKLHIATRIARFVEARKKAEVAIRKAKTELQKLDAEETKLRSEIRTLREDADRKEKEAPTQARILKAQARKKEEEARILKEKRKKLQEKKELTEKEAKKYTKEVKKLKEKNDEWASKEIEILQSQEEEQMVD